VKVGENQIWLWALKWSKVSFKVYFFTQKVKFISILIFMWHFVDPSKVSQIVWKTPKMYEFSVLVREKNIKHEKTKELRINESDDIKLRIVRDVTKFVEKLNKTKNISKGKKCSFYK
jgi:hypothetical protein